jgi:glyoxylase-like metal-dependent hydrolase (beta-lactamase superfamily II)
MPLSTEVVTGVHRVVLGQEGGPFSVNAFLVEGDDGLTIVDTGIEGSADTIMAAAEELGYGPDRIAGIVVTHCHGDHTGSLAELVRRVGGPVYMHHEDRMLTCAGEGSRPMTPSPGIELPPGMPKGPSLVEPVDPAVVVEVGDGDRVPLAGGMRVFHTPGHTAGHALYLLPRAGGTLFIGDAASNVTRLGVSMVYEDHTQASLDLERISQIDFDNALFSHGEPIVGGADEAFAALWGTS